MITVCWQRKLKCQSLYRNVPFIWPVQWELKWCICDWHNYFIYSGTPLTPWEKKLMIFCKHECMREALELLTLFVLECKRFNDCNDYLSAIKFFTYINHSCNCMIAIRTYVVTCKLDGNKYSGSRFQKWCSYKYCYPFFKRKLWFNHLMTRYLSLKRKKSGKPIILF